MVASTGRPSNIDMVTGLTAGLDEVVQFLTEMLEIAARHNVRLAIENCPVMGNIAVSPYMYELLFEKIQDRGLGWAYDPSHLAFQFCDVYAPLEDFKERIYHVHAKDTYIDQQLLAKMGTTAEQHWWHYCLPGKGVVDWTKFLEVLRGSGYDEVVSIEHEDSNWEKTPELVTEGILLSKKHLEHSMKQHKSQ
ncbi:MAG: sugar phosphate isomerase/epimerase [Firmicutes bacterium]|nr:sugar phosphate isomerase/epimerase [Bacillota bacterium]